VKRRPPRPARATRRRPPPPPAYRFYLDEDIPATAATAARGLGLDAVHASDIDPTPRPDHAHLAAAAAAGRIVVTYNRDDFLALTRDAFAAGRPHAGLIILTHKLPRTAARVAHALHRWAVAAAVTYGPPPLQPYAVIFLSD
jgi:predicted nuclease of predicted toxin-antitoxin system